MSLRLALFVLTLLLIMFPRCATDPGSSTPVSGGSVFKYSTGTADLRVKHVSSSRADLTFGIFFLLFDDGVRSTTLANDTTVSFRAPTTFTVTGCSATPEFSRTVTADTYRLDYYVLRNCPIGTELAVSASATATNTATGASRELGASGSGGSSSSGSGFNGWTQQTIFVTSGSNDGNFGGLSGADSFCEAEAAAGTATSTLQGNWMAVMSSSTSSAASRITLSNSLPIKNTNGDTVVSTADQLWSGSLLHQVQYNNYGFPTGGANIFTGTLSNGTYNAGKACSDWTSAAFVAAGLGADSRTDSYWVNDSSLSVPCMSAVPIYCINVP